MLQIDQCYWEYKHELELEAKTNHEGNNSSSGGSNNNNDNGGSGGGSNSGSKNSSHKNNAGGNKGKSGEPGSSSSSKNNNHNSGSDISKHFSSDGKLTQTEHDQHIHKGLCLVCGTPGNMAKDCNKAKLSGSGSTNKSDKNAKGHGSKVEDSSKDKELSGSDKAKN
jgi:hypothetical protein